MIYCSRMDVFTMDAVLQQMKGSEICAPVSARLQAHLRVYEGSKATWWSHLQWCLLCVWGWGRGRIPAWGWKGQTGAPRLHHCLCSCSWPRWLLAPVSPAARGCLNNGEVGCAPHSCWTDVIPATTLGAHAIPAPLRGQRVHSEILFCKESATFCFWESVGLRDCRIVPVGRQISLLLQVCVYVCVCVYYRCVCLCVCYSSTSFCFIGLLSGANVPSFVCLKPRGVH